jgi:nucleoside-diphosphate-sugar epimerase
MRFDLVANIMTAHALKNGFVQVHGGSQWRPMLHCRDAALAFKMAAEADSSLAAMQIFNVGDDSLNFTVLEIAQKVQEQVPEARLNVSEEQDVDRRDYRVSFQKINHIMGFKCTVSLEEGICEMAKQIRSTGIDYTRDIYYNVKYRRH